MFAHIQMPSFILLLIVVQFYPEHNHLKNDRIKIHNKKAKLLMFGKINKVLLVKNFKKHYFMYPFRS